MGQEFHPQLYYEREARIEPRNKSHEMISFENRLRAELPVLYRVAKRLTRSQVDAEDILGQTLLAACRGEKSFDGRHLRSWLIRILRNEYLSNQRKLALHPEISNEQEEGATESLWDEVANRIDAETLMQELDELSDEHRLIIQLCDIEELRYEEVAIALEIPIGTVRSRLFRARSKLRDRCAGKLFSQGNVR